MNRETVKCYKCEIEIWDTKNGREEMMLHYDECDGIDDPKERFKRGDRVEYSDFGRYRLDRAYREGKVVGFSDEEHCVRVLWDGRKSPMSISHRFVRPSSR